MLPNVVHTNLMNKKTGQNMVLIILQGVFGLIWYLLSLVNSLVLKIISDSIVAVASNSLYTLPNGTKFHGDWYRGWWDNHYSDCKTVFYSIILAKPWYILTPCVPLFNCLVVISKPFLTVYARTKSAQWLMRYCLFGGWSGGILVDFIGVLHLCAHKCMFEGR